MTPSDNVHLLTGVMVSLWLLFGLSQWIAYRRYSIIIKRLEESRCLNDRNLT